MLFYEGWKKARKSLLSIALLLMCFLVSACNDSNLSDEEMVSEKFEALLETLKIEDKEGLAELFSPYAKNDMASFNASVDELFEYVQGNILSGERSGGLGATGLKEDGSIERNITTSYEVITSVDTYKLYFVYIPVNDRAPDKIGINSLYVIRASEDYSEVGAYFGDGNDTPGIHVKVKNEALYFSKSVIVCDNFLKATNDEDAQALRELFSPDVVEKSSDFDKNINSLFEVCKGTVDVSHNAAERQIFEQTKHTKRINSSYYIETDADAYTLWISYVYENTQHPENVGIVSVYFGGAPDVHFDEMVYDGDGKQTPGINIVTADS